MDSGIEMFVSLTKKQADSTLGVFMKLPEDKRAWKATEKSRSAIDQIAEIAILNSAISDVLKTFSFPADYDLNSFIQRKIELCESWDELKKLYMSGTEAFLAELNKLDPANLERSVHFPWGPMAVKEIMAMPYWNMAYHEGQITFIAVMLDVEL